MPTQVNIPNGLGYASATPDNRVTALTHRRAIAALLDNTDGVVASGLLSPGNPVSGVNGAISYNVKPFAAVLTRVTDVGAVVVNSQSTITLTTPASDPVNPRIDRIYVYQPLEELSESGSALVGVAVGTVAATPPVPSIPEGALELARYRVNAGATATTGTYTNLAPHRYAQVGDLDASKITSGTFDASRIPALDASKIPALDASKIAGGTFNADRIPNLDASKIAGGTFNADRIPNLDAGKITSGTLKRDRLPLDVATGYVTVNIETGIFSTIYGENRAFVDVSFPSGRFSSTPRVSLTPISEMPERNWWSITNTTANGFTLIVYRNGGKPVGLGFHWMAIAS